MEKEKTVLEVCTDSVESAIAAKKGGADRIELCSNLIIGGTTPDTKMYRIIQNEAGIPARILIRPRFGDWRNNSIRESFPRDPQAQRY